MNPSSGLATQIQLSLQAVYNVDTCFVSWIDETFGAKTKMMTEC